MNRAFGCWAMALVAIAGIGAGQVAAADNPSQQAAVTQQAAAKDLDWEELVPEDERAHYKPGPPPPIHDYLSGRFGRGAMGGGSPDDAASTCTGLAAEFGGGCMPTNNQMSSESVNPKLDGRQVRLKGYIVPIEIGADGSVTEFFLASYVGACIHVPPPPPNQMVYVKAGRKFAARSMYDAYAITGVLRTHSQHNGFIAAAYSLDIQRIEHLK